MKDFQKAIEARCSRRKYLPALLKEFDIELLSSFISDLNTKEHVKMRLVLDNGEAFDGLRKTYGLFSGVKNYVALIGKTSDVIGIEKLGYYGEWLILHATLRGLGTCWVAGTFDKAACPVELARGESIVCVVAVGNVTPELSLREKIVHGIIHSKTKTVEQMYKSSEPTPDWFLSGMRAVQKAPSTVNRQPVMFTFSNGIVTAEVEDTESERFALDLGIAKLHFEIGAGGGSWDFGNGASFRKDGT